MIRYGVGWRINALLVTSNCDIRHLPRDVIRRLLWRAAGELRRFLAVGGMADSTDGYRRRSAWHGILLCSTLFNWDSSEAVSMT